MKQEEFAVFVGIDWADKKHDLCFQAAGSKAIERGELEQSPEAIDEWAVKLRKRFPGGKIAIGLEQSRGALIAALSKYDFLVLYPVNPSTLASYREAFTPSRAKDDPTDSGYLLELVRDHRQRLKPWLPDTVETRKLQMLCEFRRKLIGDRTKLSNRLSSYLKCYFPQILEWFPDIRTHLVCNFLLRWTTPAALKEEDQVEFLAFFRSHQSYSTKRN